MNLPDSIPQTIPVTTRIVNWLRDKISRARTGGEKPYMITHLHDRPRVTVTTDKGTFNAILFGACLYEDAIVFRLGFQANETMRVGAFNVRFGEADTSVIPPTTIEAPAGALFKFMLATKFTEIMVSPDDSPGPGEEVPEP